MLSQDNVESGCLKLTSLHLIAKKRAPVSTGNDDLETWKRQRTAALAGELADSGRFEDFTDIAYALQFEHGLTNVQALIGDADTRRALNLRCAVAREALAPKAVVVPEPVEPAPMPVAEPALPSFDSPPSMLRRAATLFRRSGRLKPVDASDLNSAAPS
jgi:hypothetical protein